MFPTTLLGVIGAALAIVITLIAWAKKSADAKAKDKADEDKKIDTLTTADDIMRGDK